MRQIKFDKSQSEAFEYALKNKLAIIQGPPGTGKTFLGAYIAETILTNTNAKIMCVC